MSRFHDPNKLDEFVRLLVSLRLQCAQPSLRELSRESKEVLEDPRYKDLKLPELTPPVLSEVLRGLRAGPPRFDWVTCFVLSCQRFAGKRGRTDPGRRTLPEWNRRLQAVHRANAAPAAEENGGQRPADETDSSSPPPAGSDRPLAPPSAEPLAAPTHTDQVLGLDHRNGDGLPRQRPADQTAVVEELQHDYVGDPGGASLSELRFFGMYGQYGAKLLKAAEDHHDLDACFRLGVLLCIDRRPAESLSWLMRAEAGKHPAASELVEAVTPRKQALDHAYRIGRAASASGDAEVARVFLERAATNGHANAAFELGTLWMEREDRAHAVYWLTRAAECGHRLGRKFADQIHHTTGLQPRPLPSPPEHSIVVPTLADIIDQVVRDDGH